MHHSNLDFKYCFYFFLSVFLRRKLYFETLNRHPPMFWQGEILCPKFGQNCFKTEISNSSHDDSASHLLREKNFFLNGRRSTIFKSDFSLNLNDVSFNPVREPKFIHAKISLRHCVLVQFSKLSVRSYIGGDSKKSFSVVTLTITASFYFFRTFHIRIL